MSGLGSELRMWGGSGVNRVWGVGNFHSFIRMRVTLVGFVKNIYIYI